MRAAGSSRGIDGGGGGGGLTSFNGRTGAVVPVAGDYTADMIPYTPTFATLATTGNPSTNVGEQLLWSETRSGTASWVWDAATAEEAAPVGAVTPNKHTINHNVIVTTPLGGAPLDLLASNGIDVVFPGSVDSFGDGGTLVRGDFAGPLIDGESVLSNLSVLNVSADPSSSDVRVESLAGRPITVDTVIALGSGGIIIEDVLAVATLKVAAIAPGPGAHGIRIDGTNGQVLIDKSFAQAPGGSDHIGIDVLPTATIAGLLFVDGFGYVSQLTGDALTRIDPSATIQAGPLPTSDIRVRYTGELIQGPGQLFSPTGRGAADIGISSSGHLNGPRSNWIGVARLDTSGAPPDALLDHTVSGGLPLVVPFDNSLTGGAGGTFRELTPSASQARHTLLLGTIETASINAGGTYTGADADYPATQASTSGGGTEATFTVTLTGGTVTAVVSRDKLGSGYANADTITLNVVGPTETVAAVLDVDLVAWAMRTNGPVDDLTGPPGWLVDFERGSGGAGSTVIGFLARRKGGVGTFVEVPASRSVPTLLIVNNPQRVGAVVKGIDDIGVGDEWRIEWINNNVGSPNTLFTIVEIDIEGQP